MSGIRPDAPPQDVRRNDRQEAKRSDAQTGKGDAADRRRPSARYPIGPAIAFVLVPLLTFLLATAAATLLRHDAPARYYQTVAFLIPSLLVTLALQGQFFRVQSVAPPSAMVADRHPRAARAWVAVQRAAAVALLLYLAAGEFTALFVLATERPSALLFGVTAGAVATAFVALGIVALRGTPWAG